jgi:hypothetical protein
MRSRLTALVLFVGSLPCCKSEEQPPPQTAPYQAYPPAPAATPAPAPAPTAPAPTTPAAPTAAPTPAPAPAGELSPPSPMALPCTADANCLTHRCNTAAGKCAWPCQADRDCNPGNRCMAGACVPQVQ